MTPAEAETWVMRLHAHLEGGGLYESALLKEVPTLSAAIMCLSDEQHERPFLERTALYQALWMGSTNPVFVAQPSVRDALIYAGQRFSMNDGQSGLVEILALRLIDAFGSLERAPSDEQRRALAQIVSRQVPWLPEHRFYLCLISYPHGVEELVKLGPPLVRQDNIFLNSAYRALLVYPPSPELLEALGALTSQRGANADEFFLRGLDAQDALFVERALPMMVELWLGTYSTIHRDLCEMIQRVGVASAAPLLEWIALHGHPSAASLAGEALRELGADASDERAQHLKQVVSAYGPFLGLDTSQRAELERLLAIDVIEMTQEVQSALVALVMTLRARCRDQSYPSASIKQGRELHKRLLHRLGELGLRLTEQSFACLIDHVRLDEAAELCIQSYQLLEAASGRSKPHSPRLLSALLGQLAASLPHHSDIATIQLRILSLDGLCGEVGDVALLSQLAKLLSQPRIPKLMSLRAFDATSRTIQRTSTLKLTDADEAQVRELLSMTEQALRAHCATPNDIRAQDLAKLLLTLALTPPLLQLAHTRALAEVALHGPVAPPLFDAACDALASSFERELLTPSCQQWLANNLDRLVLKVPLHQRAEMLRAFLPISKQHWIASLDGQQPLRDAGGHQARVLTLKPTELARELLHELYRRCDETQLRGLWRELDIATHEPLLPVWTRWARRVSPSSRHLLIERIASSGLLIAEPFLLRVVADEREDVSVRRAAVVGLGELGTRLSMAALFTLKQHKQLAEAAKVASEQINDRYPIDPSRVGALELVEDDVRGALSMVGVSEQRIALYQDVTQALEGEEGDEHGGAMVISAREDLMRLSAPPRPTFHIGAAYLFNMQLSASVMSLCCFAFFTMMLPSLLQSSFNIKSFLWTLGLGLFGLAALNWKDSLDYSSALSEGYVTTGKLVNKSSRVERRKNHEVVFFIYGFQYIDERGMLRTFTYEVEGKPLASIEDEAQEPILYTLNDAKEPAVELPLDAIEHVRIDQDGQLKLSNRLVFQASLYLVALIVTQILVWLVFIR